MGKKINCWEFTRCGLEPKGKKSMYFGVCLATIKKPLNGINNGLNAGRSCWKVIESANNNGINVRILCYTYVDNCLECNFYNLVKDQEGQKFVK